MKIIGITGTLGAGKGTIVDYLINNKGFIHFSVRAYLIEELEKRNLQVNRDTMTLLANELRANHSPAYIVEQLYNKAKNTGKNCIIESIRTPGEIELLKKCGEFYLFAVDADPKIRYNRIISRNSETDHISYETFIDNENREMTSDDPNKQNLSKCIELADFVFSNNTTIDELQKRTDEILDIIDNQKINSDKTVRPSWDEYFMDLANTVSKRATCDRGRSGCVIAKDKQILVTGYVGSPKGLPHCDEVGHQMKKTIHEDGSITNHCVRTVHAEQNAICQAAKLGISIEGSTLYCRMTPCRVCAMLIINCGIKRVVCEKKYHAGTESEELFKKANVKLEYFTDEIQKYSNQ